MAESHRQGQVTLLERTTRPIISLLLLGTVIVLIAVPIISWKWTQQPFLGLLFEHTLVVSDIHSKAWGVDVPYDSSLRLAAMDDQPVDNGRDLGQAVQDLSPGEHVTLTFEARDGSALISEDVAVQRFTLNDWLALFWLPYLVGLVYLGIGAWVFRHGGDQRSGQIFAVFCAFVALAASTLFDLNTTHTFVRVWLAAIPLAAATLVHLALVFPEEGPITRRRPWLPLLPYTLAIVLIIISQVRLYDPNDPWAYFTSWHWSYIALSFSVLVFLALMLYTRARTLSAMVRQQVRIVLVGSLLSFTPLAIYMVLAGLGANIIFRTTLYFPSLVIFPLFVSYAVLRYRLLGMELVVSRGLVYAILTAAVAGAYFAILGVLGQMLGIDVSRSHPLLLALFVVILIFVLNPLREGAERLADRLLGQRRVDYRQALQGFSRELATSLLDEQAILGRLLGQIDPVSHSAPSLVFLLDRKQGHFTLRRSSGFAAPEELDLSFGQESELAHWLGKQDGPVYLPSDERQLPTASLSPVEQQVFDSLDLALFLLLRGKPGSEAEQLRGWIGLGPRPSGEPYSPDDLAFLTALTDQAAIALENAQLLADLEQRVLQLDALSQIGEAVDLRQELDDLLDLIYAQTRRVLEVDNLYVALYNEERQEFRMAYYIEEGEQRQPSNPSWPLGIGLTSQIVRLREPIVTDDYLAECERQGVAASGRPAKAWLGVPLLTGPAGRVLGVLNVSSFQPGYHYTEEQVNLMCAIADQATVAIDRMRLYQEMEQRAAELTTLNEVSRAINTTLDLRSVLDLIMTKVVDLLDVEAGSLVLVDKEANELVFEVALRGEDKEYLVGRRHPIGQGIIGMVAQSGQSQIVPDAQTDPRWDHRIDQETGFATRSILCVPLISREDVVGVIEVINHRDGSPFNEREAELLEAFAAQAAVTIENARLYTQTDQALARRVEELSTMQRIDRELNATLDFSQVMEMTLGWALRGTNAPVGIIALYDEKVQGLLLLASQGYPPDFERYRKEPWPLGEGIVGQAVRSGEPQLVQDVNQDVNYQPIQPGTRSQLAVPIRREEQVIGVVNLESPELAAFGEDDLAFVQRLADHAAIALENARLYQESQRRAEDMALLYDISLTVSSHLALSEVLEAIYQRIRDVWDPPVFFIALYDKLDDTLDFAIYVDRGERLQPFRQKLLEKAGFSAWIVRNRQPILIDDWEQEAETSPVQGIPIGDLTRSWLGVPLIASDRMIGVMSVQDYAPNTYKEEHKRFLSTVASEVAIAIDNARLYQETEQQLKELSLLFDTSAAVSKSLDLDRVLQTTARQITAALAADGCTISTWDRENNNLVTQLDYSADPDRWEPEAPGTTYSLADYPTSRRVLAERQPVAIKLSEPDADPVALEWMAKEDVKALLMMPLVVLDEAIGLLELMQLDEERVFTATEISLCQTLASQAAAALQNANLYEGVRDANLAKSEFIDFVAHELKQPMTAMQGYAKLLTMGIGGELTEKQNLFVEVINSNVTRMGKLVNDLLEISRLEAGRTKLKVAPVQMKAVIEETVISTRTEIEARHHTLDVDVPDDLPPVLGDRERLIQILTNLVSNAYKYTPDGGQLRIAADGRDCPDVPQGHLCVTVSDTGIGMTPQDLVKLEEKFFRADHELVQSQPGTGLGVSITRSLVELHGGEFLVESEPDRGSTFAFTVPIAATGDE